LIRSSSHKFPSSLLIRKSVTDSIGNFDYNDEQKAVNDKSSTANVEASVNITTIKVVIPVSSILIIGSISAVSN